MEEMVLLSLIEARYQLSEHLLSACLVLALNQGVEFLGKCPNFAFGALVTDAARFVLPDPLLGLKAICHEGVPVNVLNRVSPGYYFEERPA